VNAFQTSLLLELLLEIVRERRLLCRDRRWSERRMWPQ
jgi:hypothetical protein